ncbi:MAG: flagellar protein FlaG [Deltaproteobacteria bacterium]|nr:flagellar protein FlaG [Deltaproteobacteria bacterium]
MLIESIGGSKNSQVVPVDTNTQPEKSESQKETTKTEEPIVKEQQETAEITQEMLDMVGENFKLIHEVDLRFSIHEATGRTLVKVVSSETGEMVREIPPEQMLDLAAKIDEMMGILFDQKV